MFGFLEFADFNGTGIGIPSLEFAWVPFIGSLHGFGGCKALGCIQVT